MSHPASHEDRYAPRENPPATTSASRIAISVSARIPPPHFLDSLRISPVTPGLAVADSTLLEPCRSIRRQIHARTFTSLALNTCMNLKENL
jgi:hypothetical protein